jgi:hypothetical protein
MIPVLCPISPSTPAAATSALPLDTSSSVHNRASSNFASIFGSAPEVDRKDGAAQASAQTFSARATIVAAAKNTLEAPVSALPPLKTALSAFLEAVLPQLPPPKSTTLTSQPLQTSPKPDAHLADSESSARKTRSIDFSKTHAHMADVDFGVVAAVVRAAPPTGGGAFRLLVPPSDAGDALHSASAHVEPPLSPRVRRHASHAADTATSASQPMDIDGSSQILKSPQHRQRRQQEQPATVSGVSLQRMAVPDAPGTQTTTAPVQKSKRSTSALSAASAGSAGVPGDDGDGDTLVLSSSQESAAPVQTPRRTRSALGETTGRTPRSTRAHSEVSDPGPVMTSVRSRSKM